jgi:hypothetical protein
LLRPIYKKTAAYGHFGRTEKTFTWEATDRAEELADALLPKTRGASTNGKSATKRTPVRKGGRKDVEETAEL